jgi:hypothetical protein
MKQTATDYLYKQFMKAFIEYIEENIDGAKFSELMIEARVKSQLMEKEQIIDAYLKDKVGKFDAVLKLMDNAEQYYNETFKQ